MELGMISSTWIGTKVGLEEGIRRAKEIGFDTYDIFEDPLDIDDATRALIRDTCAEAGLPIRSVVCVGFGLVDFNPSVRRFTLDRIKAYVDQGAYLGARNVLLVVGEYFWDGEVFPRSAIWDMAKELVAHGRASTRPRRGSRSCSSSSRSRKRCSRTSTSSPASCARSTIRPCAPTRTSRTCTSRAPRSRT